MPLLSKVFSEETESVAFVKLLSLFRALIPPFLEAMLRWIAAKHVVAIGFISWTILKSKGTDFACTSLLHSRISSASHVQVLPNFVAYLNQEYGRVLLNTCT